MIVRAPLPGKILRLNLKNNAQVKKGQLLLVMESMKLILPVHAATSGLLRYEVAAGDRVMRGKIIARIENAADFPK